MKNSMITWMKDRNETRAGQGTGKKEQVPSPGFYERKKACSVTCRMLDEKNVWGNKHWAMLAQRNTKTEQQCKNKRYERTEY